MRLLALTLTVLWLVTALPVAADEFAIQSEAGDGEAPVVARTVAEAPEIAAGLAKLEDFAPQPPSVAIELSVLGPELGRPYVQDCAPGKDEKDRC